MSACAQREREDENDRSYSHCLPFGKYFVKFSPYSSFYPEVVTLNYLADLAKRQGSMEQEYTDVHGVCDVAHTQELFRALEAEISLAHDSHEPEETFFEGVEFLRTLICDIVAEPDFSGS